MDFSPLKIFFILCISYIFLIQILFNKAYIWDFLVTGQKTKWNNVIFGLGSSKMCLIYSSPHIHGFTFCGQRQSNNIKWKISRINNSYILNCKTFWIVRWNLAVFCCVLPGMWIIPLSNLSPLSVLPTQWLLISCLGYQINKT